MVDTVFGSLTPNTTSHNLINFLRMTFLHFFYENDNVNDKMAPFPDGRDECDNMLITVYFLHIYLTPNNLKYLLDTYHR